MNLHSVLFAPAAEAVDSLVAELYDLGTAGIIEEGDRIRAFFEDDIDCSALLDCYPVLEMRREDTAADFPIDLDWDPIFAGEKFFIVSPLSDLATPQGRYRLTIDDANTFGTGRHETTQLMLVALEQILTTGGQTVLDVGAGTGILSMAAHLLGAERVFSCDIYEAGVQSSHRQFGLPSFVGSADAVRDRMADITLANISSRVLDAIAHDLKRVSAPGGKLLISGFLAGAEPTRFKPEAVWDQDGWLCWLCNPQDIHTAHQETGIVVHSQQWW